jgi:hypothetical protein
MSAGDTILNRKSKANKEWYLIDMTMVWKSLLINLE